MRTRGWIALVGASVTVGVAGLVAWTAVQVEADLQTARSAFASVTRPDVDPAALTAAAERGAVAASAAADRTDGLLWRSLGVLPVVGDQTAAVADLAAVADAVGTVAVTGADRFAGLLAGDAAIPVVDGAIDLAALDDLLAGVADLPVEDLERAVDRLDRYDDVWLVRRIDVAVDEARELGGRAVGVVDAVRLLDGLVLPMLGAEQPRTYFLALQNPSEIRGTGGFLGFLATLTIDDGRMTVGPVVPYEVTETLGDGPQVVTRGAGFDDPSRYDDPVPRSDEIASRYDHVQVGGFIGNANVHPDLALTAPSLLALIERNTDTDFDGIVAIDPVALELLQGAIGPLDVPDGVAVLAPGLPDPIPPSRLTETVLTDVYQELGGPTPERKAYHAALARAAVASVLSGEWPDPPAFARRLLRAFDERHVQVYSSDASEQARLEALGVAGRLTPVGTADDLVAVTANNAGANKQDVLLGHRFGVDLALSSPDLEAGLVRVDRTVEVTLDNPLSPDGLDSYLSGISGQGDGAQGNFEQRRFTAANRTWFSVWAPAGAGFTAARDHDGEPIQLGVGRVGEVVGFDHHVETPAGESRSWEVDVTSTAPIVVEGGDIVYSVTLWRQAKAIPDLWDVRITPPSGWSVTSHEVRGGGVGTGTGVHGEGIAPVVEQTDRSLTVRRASTQDLVVEVRMSRD